MKSIVDLTNLRSMTDGDVEMERALFDEFYTAFEFGLQTLATSCGDDKAELWRSTAHALKGMALNLGAEQLGEICKWAQDEASAAADRKNELLNQMGNSYQDVKQFLETECSGTH